MRGSSFLLVLSTSSIAWGWVTPPDSMITPAPAPELVELRKRQSVGLASILPVLETAVPASILELALTNIPAVSRLLWSEFLDNNTPSWFAALPSDIQTYLKGQFGPTTTSSHSSSSTPASTSASATSPSSTASQTATASQAENTTSSHHHDGLPLWAKIVIGILVPLIVIGLIVLLILCCVRRRRRRMAVHNRNGNVESRVPTPAFISSSYGRHNAQHSHQNIPLNSGYLSAPVAEERTSSHHVSSNSTSDFHTPIGGPSYEDIPPPAAAGAVHHSRRSSRQSLSSLHSVPEVPEPMHGGRQPHIVGAMNAPPRSPRRSQDLSQGYAAAANSPVTPKNEKRVSPLNPAYSNNSVSREMGSHPYYNQGVYASDGPYQQTYNDHRRSDPFADNKGYGYNAGGGYGGANGHEYEPEPFLRAQEPRHEDGFEWPLRSPTENGHGKQRRMSWERGDDYQAPY